ncbi:MAG: hypothetical protein R2824_16685 [Saprospiraceae bacterium]
MQKPSLVSVLSLLMLGTSEQKSTKQISLVINKKGKIRYKSADGDEQKLRAGALIRNSGSLQLNKDATVLLYSDGRFLIVDEAGGHSLEELLPSGGMKKLNYDARFGQYLMAAVDLVVHADDDDGWGELSGSKGGGDGWGELSGSKGGGDGWGDGELSGSKGGGDGWGDGELSGSKGGGDGWGDGELSGSKGGGDGWGDKDGRIVPILPFGKVPVGPVIFQWSEPRISKDYVLEIFNEAGSIVHSTQVKDNWAQVNMESLPVTVGEKYAWRIDVPSHPESTSTKARIILTDEQANEIIHQKLERSDAYQLDDPVLCGLMEAVVLEEQAHFYEAYERYEMLRQFNKKNNLVKLMQAAFYVRHQLKPRAQLIFR